MYIYIYVYVCMYIHVCIYLFIYLKTLPHNNTLLCIALCYALSLEVFSASARIFQVRVYNY